MDLLNFFELLQSIQNVSWYWSAFLVSAGRVTHCPSVTTLLLVFGSVLCGVTSVICSLIAINPGNLDVRPCDFRGKLTFEITLLIRPWHFVLFCSTFYYRKFLLCTRVYLNEPKRSITQHVYSLKNIFMASVPYPILSPDFFNKTNDITLFQPQIFQNISLFKDNPIPLPHLKSLTWVL